MPTSQQPQTVTVIGSQHQQLQQQQQLYHSGKSAIQFQPPKPASFFESDIQQQQQHNIDQVLKDVNSYSIKNSQMMTPQEKYVMYLQQRMRYNKHQQQQHATRLKYREHNSNDKQHQQNPTQIFLISSTMSPPRNLLPGTITGLAPIRPSQAPLKYDLNYPQHSATHHDVYTKTLASGGVRTRVTTGATAGDEAEEHVLTIPVHSLFGELETLQHQQHNHYSQSHSDSPSSNHKSQYFKNG